MRVISFDIGVKNFAWCVTEFKDSPASDEIFSRQMAGRDTINWWSAASWSDWWDMVYSDVMCIKSLSNIDLTSKKNTDVYRTLHSVLQSNIEMFRTIDTILVEQQMSARHNTNVQALKISQHVLAFFYIHFPEKEILEFQSFYKTMVFGCFENKKNDRKKFAVTKASEICTTDPVALDMFGSFTKKDDISDCLLMCVAFYFKTIAGDRLVSKKQGSTVRRNKRSTSTRR